MLLNFDMIRIFDEEKVVKADLNNFYLDDILGQKENRGIYDDMMNTKWNHISFLNKGMCGNGGTTGLVRYALSHNKGLLVLVPNVSICKSKEKDYENNPDVCVVYGGSKDFNPDAQVVIATYDQFNSLLHKLSSGGVCSGDDLWTMTFWGGRTIVIDEYHKLIDDSGYRVVCKKITELIKMTESPVVLMSATPNDDYIKMIRDLLPERTIYSYDVQYSKMTPIYDTRIDVYDVKQKELKDIFKNMLDSPNNQQICVFYNCVKEIKTLLEQIGDDRCEVLCSTDSKDKVGKYYSKDFNENKKLHFLTSAYFTGQDIKTPVDKCVIVGSCEFDYMCLSERDIKQIIGRFRIKDGGVRNDGVQLFYMKRVVNQKNYMLNKNTYEECSNDLKIFGDRWTEWSKGIPTMHNLLRTKDALRRYEMWKSYDQLKKTLTDYGFQVNRVNTDFLQTMKLAVKKKHLSFEKAKERLKQGQDVDFDEYPDINELKAYKDIKGVSEMMSKRISKQDIHNWYKVYMISQGKDLNVEKSKLPDIFGIQSFGRYNAKYLNACLVFLDEEGDYDNLAVNMYDKMVCYAIPWKLDNNGHKQNNSWLVIPFSSKNGGETNHSLIRDKSKIPPKFEENGADIKLSIETSNQGTSYATTISLSEAVKTGMISKLTGISLYDWVNEDKEHRLPAEKKTKAWTDIKRFCQSKISDMYKDTDKIYKYRSSEMNLADCLIIDIDGGLSFNEFQKKYERWTWIAYPTINNISENWTKFRVIVPLAHTIRLEGEHNLKVLKLLRTMFCHYEDPDHQVYSYINIEDLTRLQGNKGEVYDIPQEFVNCLGMCLKESYDYNSRKFEKKTVNYEGRPNGDMTLNDAKSLFLNALSNPEDGARHFILYPIKKGLCIEDREEFEKWLGEVYPEYIKHWNSHRV